MNTFAARQGGGRGVVIHGTHWLTATTADFCDRRNDPRRLCLGLELCRTRNSALAFALSGAASTGVCGRAADDLSEVWNLSLRHFIRMRTLPFKCARTAWSL